MRIFFLMACFLVMSCQSTAQRSEGDLDALGKALHDRIQGSLGDRAALILVLRPGRDRADFKCGEGGCESVEDTRRIVEECQDVGASRCKFYFVTEAFVLQSFEEKLREPTDPTNPEIRPILLALSGDPGVFTYLRSPGNRALAVSLDPDTGFIRSIGYSRARERLYDALWEAVHDCGSLDDGTAIFDCRVFRANGRVVWPLDVRRLSPEAIGQMSRAAADTPVVTGDRDLILSIAGQPDVVAMATYRIAGGDMTFSFDSDELGGTCHGGTDGEIVAAGLAEERAFITLDPKFYIHCDGAEPIIGRVFGNRFHRAMMFRFKDLHDRVVSLRLGPLAEDWGVRS